MKKIKMLWKRHELINLLYEFSADLQEKTEDNEFMRAEIEDYFEDKVKKMVFRVER